MTEFKSATNLENAFAQLLKKSAREVVKVFEFSEDNDVVMAHQLPDAYIDREDWLKIHHACREAGGQSNKDEKTGHWFFRFPKAAAPSETRSSLSQAPKQQPGPQTAAAGQPQAQTTSPSMQKWNPEYPAKDAPVTPGYYPEFPVDRIVQPAFNFRQDLKDGINALMAEIHAAGMIIEPIICRPATATGYVVIGPGERRLYASKQLGMKTVPVIVKDLNDVEFDRVRLLENLARKDLSDMETSRVLKYLMDKYPQEYPTQETLAQAFGKTQQWVSNHLAMLQLEHDEFTTRVVKTEKLSEGQAREIIAAPPEKREEVAKLIAEHIEAEGKPPSMADIRKVSRPDEGQRVRCTRCGNPTSKPVDIDGEQYCQTCSAVVKSKPKPKEASVSFPIPLIRDQGIVSQEVAVPPGFEPETPSKDVIKEHEEPKQTEKEPIDTGVFFECPECHETYTIIHVAKGKHRFEPLTVMEEEKSA